MNWLRPSVRVALLGDSHMIALGPRLARLLPERTGVSVPVVEARGGWTTRRYVQAGDIGQLTQGADIAVIELGGNDAASHFPNDAYTQDMLGVLRQVKSPRVIWVGPSGSWDPELEAHRQRIRDVQRSVLSARGIPWIDGSKLTRISEIGNRPENRVHFTREGYNRYADGLANALARVPSSGLEWAGPVALGGAAALALGAAGWYWLRRRRR